MDETQRREQPLIIAAGFYFKGVGVKRTMVTALLHDSIVIAIVHVALY